LGSIALYLAEIKHYKSKIVLKFPNNFFAQYNYFFGINYKCVIKTNIYLKNIYIQKLLKYYTYGERIILHLYYDFFSHIPIQYTSNIKFKPSFNNNYITKNNNNNNSQILKLKININQIEKIRGFFFSIPDEIIDFINEINFSFKNYLNIDNNPIKQNYNLKDMIIFKETDYSKIYWVPINPLDINPFQHKIPNIYYLETYQTDSVEIIFNEQYEMDYIENILIDIMVSNILIGKNNNSKLKYINQKLNPELEIEELEIVKLELINKYSILDENDLINDLIIKNIDKLNNFFINKSDNNNIIFFKNNSKTITYLKKFINRY